MSKFKRVGAIVSAMDALAEPQQIYEIVDAVGRVEGPFTRAAARSYARLWDRDCSDVAPHMVRRAKREPS